MKHIYGYRIKELCIKLVIEISLYYDARSEKHQILLINFFLSSLTMLIYQQRLHIGR